MYLSVLYYYLLYIYLERMMTVLGLPCSCSFLFSIFFFVTFEM